MTSQDPKFNDTCRKRQAQSVTLTGRQNARRDTQRDSRKRTREPKIGGRAGAREEKRLEKSRRCPAKEESGERGPEGALLGLPPTGSPPCVVLQLLGICRAKGRTLWGFTTNACRLGALVPSIHLTTCVPLFQKPEDPVVTYAWERTSEPCSQNTRLTLWA